MQTELNFLCWEMQVIFTHSKEMFSLFVHFLLAPCFFSWTYLMHSVMVLVMNLLINSCFFITTESNPFICLEIWEIYKPHHTR